MEKSQRATSQAGEDGFSQFFIEPAPSWSGAEFALSNDAQEVLAKLLDSYRKLRAASYRIGYLEGRLQRYRKLSTTLTTQAVANRLSKRNDRPLPQKSTATESRLLPTSTGCHSEFNGCESNWWQALADGVIGAERPRGMAGARGKILSGNNYYTLIRQGLER
jgi:hypothetical protein